MLDQTPETWAGLTEVGLEFKELQSVLLSTESEPAVNITYERWGMQERMDDSKDREFVMDYLSGLDPRGGVQA